MANNMLSNLPNGIQFSDMSQNEKKLLNELLGYSQKNNGGIFGISQSSLAKSIGISQTMVSKYISHLIDINILTLVSRGNNIKHRNSLYAINQSVVENYTPQKTKIVRVGTGVTAEQFNRLLDKVDALTERLDMLYTIVEQQAKIIAILESENRMRKQDISDIIASNLSQN